ncbi:MAG: hypothetical protein GEV13_25500 [Rhodospirillales bacterium]|nr:hypothetical protein [Rhodospirillales bacterium]
MRKMVNIDTVTVAALERLAADKGSSLQDLVEEVLADLLKKHDRPITTKEMFAASLKDGRRRKHA